MDSPSRLKGEHSNAWRPLAPRFLPCVQDFLIRSNNELFLFFENFAPKTPEVSLSPMASWTP